jgi:MFS family permease
MGGRAHPVPERRFPVWATLAVLIAAGLSFAITQSIMVPALPLVQEHLHTSQSSVSWVFTAYLLSASIFTPILGRLGDMYGKRRMLMLSLTALAGGAVVAALTTSIAVMIAARAFQGLAGGILPLSFGLARDELPPEQVPSAIGGISSVGGAGTGIGLVLCGPLIDLFGYSSLFWTSFVAAGLSVVAAFVVLQRVPASATRGRIGWAAPLLLSTWLVALLLGISKAPTWGWGSPRTLGLIGIGLALIPVWCIVEARSATPLIDMHMMRRTGVWTSNLIALLFGAGLYATFVYLPAFLQSPPSNGYGFGATITESGLVLLPFTLTAFVVGVANQRIERWLGMRTLITAGCVIGVAGFVLLTVLNATEGEIIISMLVMGTSFGLLFAALAKAVVAAVPAEQTGVATGMNANIRTLGGAIGAAVMSTIVASSAGANGVPAASGYETAFLVMAGALVVAAIASVIMPRAEEPELEEPPVTYVELGFTPASPDPS